MRRVKRTTHYLSAYTLKYAFILPTLDSSAFPTEQRAIRPLNLTINPNYTTIDDVKNSKCADYLEFLKKESRIQGYFDTEHMVVEQQLELPRDIKKQSKHSRDVANVSIQNENAKLDRMEPVFAKNAKLDRMEPVFSKNAKLDRMEPVFPNIVTKEFIIQLGDYLLYSRPTNASSLISRYLIKLGHDNLTQLHLYPLKVYLKYFELDEISKKIYNLDQSLRPLFLTRVLDSKNVGLIFDNLNELMTTSQCLEKLLDWMLQNNRYFEKQSRLIATLLSKNNNARLQNLVLRYVYQSNGNDLGKLLETGKQFKFNQTVQETILELLIKSEIMINNRQ